jgi:capsular polysaccharide biosynthesis protein
MLSPNRGIDPPERTWADEDLTPPEDGTADFNVGLTSLGFVRTAIRRSRRAWCAAAAVGFLIGLGVYVTSPPVYQAETTLLLTNGPEPQPGTAVQDDQTIAQSIPVAALALHKLGLQESVSSFLASYTATPVTDRILSITVNAPSSSDAVVRARALATAFLGYRAAQLEAQQKQLFSSLDRQIVQARQQVARIKGEMKNLLTKEPPSPARRAQLSNLQTQGSQATNALGQLVQSTGGTRASTQTLTTTQITGSQVLNPAALLAHSRLKHLILYSLVGLILGLVLGLGVVIIRAIISDRLRRRDDIAHALGAPVKLSVGPVRLSRWRPGRRGLEAAQNSDIQRIVIYLGNAVRPGGSGIAALAVIPVDDPQVAALSLASLASSCAQEGFRVILADLCHGSPAAKLLGATDAGIQQVHVNDRNVLVVIPDPNDVELAGPLHRLSRREKATDPLVAACASADLLLTLAPLDPSVGGEYLATWAADAVAMITAGRSNWTRIHAVGEMARLAGTRLVSAVVVGADKTDDSLGVPYPSQDGQDAAVAGDGQDAAAAGDGQDAAAAGRSRHRGAQDVYVTADRGPSGG